METNNEILKEETNTENNETEEIETQVKKVKEKEKTLVVETDEDNYVTSISRLVGITAEELAKIPDPEFQDCYQYINNEFIKDEEKYNKKLQNKNMLINNMQIQKQIYILKEELASTDYQVIKCYESQLAGEELPYDITTVHEQRSEIRKKINELEQSLQ